MSTNSSVAGQNVNERVAAVGSSAPLRTLSRLAARYRRIEDEGAMALPWWVHAVVLGVLGLVVAYIAGGLWGWTYDDVFIIFRYARNFANGLGMVYNPGEAYLGTSSISYTLVLAGLHKLAPGVDFLVLGSIVSTVGCFATGALFWLLGVQTRSPLAGALAGLLAITSPVIVEVWGGEMYILLPLVLACILSYVNGMGILTGVLLALAVLTRMDGFLLVGLIGAHYVLTKRRIPVAPAVAFLAVLIPWFTYSWLFFGTPLPATLEAKIAQGKAGWAYYLSGSIQWMSARLGPGMIRPLVFALIGVGALTLAVELRWKRLGPWFMLLAWAALFTAGYTVLRVAFYGWYAVPPATGFAVLIAWGIAGIVELVVLLSMKIMARLAPTERWWMRGVSYALGGIALLVVASPVADRTRLFVDNYITNHRLSDLYARIGNWLHEQGGPAVSVAYLEVGEVGYYSDSRVIDLVGLVTPGAAAHVPYWDYGWAVQRYRPDFYVANSRFNTLLLNVEQEKWFTDVYERAATFEERRKVDPTVHETVVYRLKSGAELPAPLRPVAVQRASQQHLWLKPDLPASQRFGQTFTVQEPSLAAVALLMGKPNEAVTGRVVLHLRSSPDDTHDIRRASAPLADIVNNGWYTFRFEPVADSAGKTYFFTLELDGTPPRQPPPAFWISTDDLYPGGARYEGLEAATGDFCMRVGVLDAP